MKTFIIVLVFVTGNDYQTVEQPYGKETYSSEQQCNQAVAKKTKELKATGAILAHCRARK